MQGVTLKSGIVQSKVFDFVYISKFMSAEEFKYCTCLIISLLTHYTSDYSVRIKDLSIYDSYGSIL
jgi:hypothetical protein